MSKIDFFYKEEDLEEVYSDSNNKINIPTHQTHNIFDSKNNLDNFIKRQFPTEVEYKKYKEYREQWHYRAKNFDPGDFPLAVCCELVSTCNLSCSMCYTVTDSFKNSVIGAQRMMPWKMVKKIINEASELGVYSILFSWRGEPTLYRDKDENGNIIDFPTVLKYAREKGILEITAVTHGQEINKEMAEKIVDAEPSWISFSLDGIRENYNKIRTPTKWKGKKYDAFKIVCENIKNLANIRDERGKTRPAIRSNSIYPAIENDEEEYYEILKSLGVDMVTVNELLDIRTGKPNDEMINKDWACQYPFQRISISANGVMVPCTGAHKEEEGLVLGIYEGSAKKQLRNVDGSINTIELPFTNIKDAWRSEKLNNIRYLHKTNRRIEIEPGCRNCSHGQLKFGVKRKLKNWDYKNQCWTSNLREG